MNTASLLITTDPEIKRNAQKNAKELGIPFNELLADITNSWLMGFARIKNIRKMGNTITIHLIEKPSNYFKKTLKKAENERKKGKASPIFDNAEDAETKSRHHGISLSRR